MASPELKDSKSYHLTDNEWREVEDIVKVLEPVKIATDMFQKEQFTLSDFYRTWLGVQIKLKGFSELKLARDLLSAMEKREEALFSNNALLGCLFLDPRLSSILTADQKTAAKLHLASLHRHLIALKNGNDVSPAPSPSPSLEEVVAESSLTADGKSRLSTSITPLLLLQM